MHESSIRLGVQTSKINNNKQNKTTPHNNLTSLITKTIPSRGLWKRRQWWLLGDVKSGDMSGVNEDEPVSAPDRQLNRRKEWRDRIGKGEGGEDWAVLL